MEIEAPALSNGRIQKPENLSPEYRTKIGVTALDAIVNVNSLFTVATFIGISFTPPVSDGGGSSAAPSSSSCIATEENVRKLVLYEVISFSFFLFSSVIAQGLKLGISIANSKDKTQAADADIHYGSLTAGLIGSGVGSLLGCIFLTLSMVEVIEVRLGLNQCGGKSLCATATICVLVGVSLLAYLWFPFRAHVKKY